MRTIGWKPVVFNTYKNLPEKIGTYDNKDWIKKQIHRVEDFKNEINLAVQRNKVFIDKVGEIEKDKINIIDVGGGFGLSYLPLIHINGSENINNYHIVEGEKVCAAAKKYFKNNDKLSFTKNIINKFTQSVEFDVCYIRSSLQYVQDWKKTISEILELEPQKIIFSHLAAGNVESFLTIQVWGDQDIPYWVISESDLTHMLLEGGYLLKHRGISEDVSQNKIWESFRNLPEENLIHETIFLEFERMS